MQQPATPLTQDINQKRVHSIDILRGIVMLIMALDHVRDYFHIYANTDDPLNLQTTTPTLFFTRWITHFCAPVFVFLSGASIYLQSLRKTKKELSSFLVKRGLWLVFVEFAIISFAWSFDPHYHFIFLQVIWAIGISMFLLGLLTRLPFNIILALGLLIVFGHNLLDKPESAAGFRAGFWWDLLHHARFAFYPYTQGHAILIVYPFIPWMGLMILGYCAGTWFAPDFPQARRRKILLFTGIGLIALFVIARWINYYGDPDPWSSQKNTVFTLLSFLNVHKYPPSLLYSCITIGPALLFLSFIGKFGNAFTRTVAVYGRVAFFYYVLHLYLIHFLSAVCYLMRGHSFHEGAVTSAGANPPFNFVAAGEGYSLGIVYLVWILVIVLLYPLCKWYDNYKSRHKEIRWLSYL